MSVVDSRTHWPDLDEAEALRILRANDTEPVGFQRIRLEGKPCPEPCLAPGSSPHSHSIHAGWHLIGRTVTIDLDADGNVVRASTVHTLPLEAE